MSMREYNPNLYPPDGYTFLDRDGTRHRGDGWKNLIYLVTRYRETNGFEVGNPWEEIQAQHCAKMPAYCSDPQPAPVPSSAHSLTFNQRVLQWAAEACSLKRVNALPRVDDELANHRAEICLRCPRQKSLTNSCEACLTALGQARRALLDGEASRHQNLLCCDALGEDCSTTVHLKNHPVGNSSELPANCWRKG